jgi:4-amino-4-deoxy-L-arabinose transferase-like glycosyltransferase
VADFKFSKETTAATGIIILAGLVFAIRAFCLHFATMNSADSATRVWIAWQWLSDPKIITHGVWGPLHFYLIAASMALVRDPVFSPILLHVVIGSLTPVLVYFFTIREFVSHRASMLVALTYAFYPIAISNSLTARSETPFVFFLLLSLILVSDARQQRVETRMRRRNLPDTRRNATI